MLNSGRYKSDYHSPDGRAHHRDQDRLDHAGEGGDGRLDLLVVEVGDLGEHGVQGAGLLADGHHLDDHGREGGMFGQRGGEALALANRVLDVAHGAGDDLVVDRLGDDLQALEDGDARADQGGQGAGEPGKGALVEQRAEHLDLELEPVPLVAALLAGLPLAEQEDEHADEQQKAAQAATIPMTMMNTTTG